MEQSDGSDDFKQPMAHESGAPYETPRETTDQSAAADETQDAAVYDTAPEEPEAEDDSAVLHWQAPEYLEHDRGAAWYTVFLIVTLGLMAVAILLLKSITFAILIPFMAAALFIYTRRSPQTIDYTLSRQGIHVNDKLYAYTVFKSFSIISHAGNHSVLLVPRKRFQMGLTAYLPEEVGEPLVDMLAARLPMQPHQPDAIDKLLTKLRI